MYPDPASLDRLDLARCQWQWEHGHELARLGAQLGAEILQRAADITGLERVDVALGMLAYGLFVHAGSVPLSTRVQRQRIGHRARNRVEPYP